MDLKTKQFNEEAMPHYNLIFHAARRRLCYDQEKAKDLTQDVFTKAWLYWNSYTCGTNCRAWLFRILFTMNLDLANRNYSKVMRELLQSDATPKIAECVASDQKTPLEELLKKEQEREVYFAIVALPALYYDVMFPLVYHGLSYKQIAEQIGMEEGTVKSRVSRSRELLKKSLRHLRLETV